MKIATKLWLWMTLLVIVVVSLSLSFQTFLLEDMYIAFRSREVLSRSTQSLQSGNMGELRSLELRFNAGFYILNETYSKYIYTSENLIFPNLISKSYAGYFTTHKDVNYLEATIIHPAQQVPWTLIGTEVRIPGGQTLSLFVIFPIEDVSGMASLMARQFIYISAGLILLAAVLAFFLSRSFTSPVREIEKVTLSMAEGNLDVRLTPRSNDEVGQLSGAINTLGQSLARMEQLRRELIANISHELRTPLALIRGYAETIRDVTGPEPEVRNKQLDTIVEETMRLSDIVNTIMDYSQIQSGYLKLEKRPLDLSELAQDVVELYELEFEAADIRPILEIKDDLHLNADPGKVKQILHNLINNALNHTPTGGTVTIGIWQQYSQAYLSVSDTGRGVPLEDLPHIFDRFYKSPVQTGRRRKGTGLGLSIALSLAKAHGGAVTARNLPEGGACFTLILPMQP